MESLIKAPDFSLPDQNGNLFHLADHIGKKKLVIFFYPKDETPTCTKEACAFRDSFEVFADAGAMVIGISADSPESHRAFQQHHHLPYTLLSDAGGQVAKAFGVKKKLLLIPGRETFIVDLNGHIAFHHKDMMNSSAHVQQTLRYLKERSETK